MLYGLWNAFVYGLRPWIIEHVLWSMELVLWFIGLVLWSTEYDFAFHTARFMDRRTCLLCAFASPGRSGLLWVGPCSAAEWFGEPEAPSVKGNMVLNLCVLRRSSTKSC